MQREFENTFEPGINISESGLPGFQTDHAGDNGAVHLSANAFYQIVSDLFIGSYHHIAGRRTDHPDECVGSHSGTDSTHMAIECPSGNHYFGGQSETCRPFFGQMSDRFVGGFCFFEQTVAESCQQRVYLGKEFIRRQSAPFFVPHRFMTTGTTATHNITACLDSGDKCRQPFAIFYDAICFGAYRFVCSQHVQGLCPIPFGRIDSAFIG